MASGIFAILDDIAALMDDVAVASKIATQKTAGILGDDLAVNAEKATGFLSSRELPVLWKITKGSLLNKLVIIPVVFLLNFFLPIAITVVLVGGGIYLAYEGAEKIVEWLFHKEKKGKEVINSYQENDQEVEKVKVRSAISTDFILSIEIIIIALSTVLHKTLPIQIATVIVVAILATVGVYGFVALIVRMDDVGFKLIKRSKNKGMLNWIGKLLVNALPWIIKFFAIVGTIALFLVSGGIFEHNLPFLHGFLNQIPEGLLHLCYGLLAGAVAFLGILMFKKVVKRVKIKKT